MKILIFVAVLLAVCGQSAVNVQADVIEWGFMSGVHYTCLIDSIKQDENENVITGNHETGKSDSDVEAVFYWAKNFINLTNFDSIFCQNFPNLVKFNLDKLKPANLIENALHGCPNLVYFRLSSADITQIPDNFFSNNLKLKDLNLYQNRLETLPENIFKSLTKLTFLRLRDNKLSTLNPGWFNDLRNLIELSLSSNKIKDLPEGMFVGLEKLERLFISDNNLVTIHADSFGKKPLLTDVGLSNNQITSIDEKFIDDTAVDDLYLDGNSCSVEIIRSRDEIKKIIQQCFNNYQSRTEVTSTAVPSTSTTETPALSAAPPKHKIKWNLWLSLSLLTFSFWQF